MSLSEGENQKLSSPCIQRSTSRVDIILRRTIVSPAAEKIDTRANSGHAVKCSGSWSAGALHVDSETLPVIRQRAET